MYVLIFHKSCLLRTSKKQNQLISKNILKLCISFEIPNSLIGPKHYNILLVWGLEILVVFIYTYVYVYFYRSRSSILTSLYSHDINYEGDIFTLVLAFGPAEFLWDKLILCFSISDGTSFLKAIRVFHRKCKYWNALSHQILWFYMVIQEGALNIRNLQSE